MLNKQYNIYSVDTEYFYTKKERYLHKKRSRLTREYDKLNILIQELKEKGGDDDKSKLDFYKQIKKMKGQKVKNTKEKLIQCFQDRLKSTDVPRELKHISNSGTEVISIFDSNVTRLLHMSSDGINEDLIIVRTYFFDILQDIILNGFVFKGKKYRFFTASAGQIRTKKAVFIQEDKWDKYEKVLMCGLTIDKINEKGGMNINKFLAYLALNNSATDEWKDFDIDKTIVVPDYETLVNGTVDYIDYKTFEIERKNMDIPITHTDGAGMVLPRVSNKNFMIRLAWIKGLLCVFDFVKFIENFNGSPVVKDIYGKEHNLIEEDIQIIFTKSQFKAYQYYDSWEEYKQYFKQYHCKAGVCNIEEDIIPKAQINYQMLQTLPDITNQELQWLADKSNNKLLKLTSTLDSMKQVFGVTDSNKNKTYLQQALEIYPELFQDIYCKEVLKQIKKAMVKRYRSGKLEIDGKYTFIIPDWFAVCEYMFLHIDKPIGLLRDKQVSCKLYRTKDTLDCLRSPHLYREHAIRENINNDATDEWFVTDGIYISTYDLISKLLQCDVDGDKSLVVSDKTFLKIVKRNMTDIVPLYYEMKKASPELITKQSVYQGMILAYTGGNIGMFSNSITKIWNNEVWWNGMDNQKQEALNTIKHLCLISNFSIDYAKTLFKPVVPENIKDLIHHYTKCKVPYFFQYAKDKESTQIEPFNESVVNRLSKIIVNRKLHFGLSEFGKFDYTLLMNNPHIEIDNNVVREYLILNKLYRFQLKVEDNFEKSNNVNFLSNMIVNTLKLNKYSKSDIADMLLKYLYTIKDSASKECLWFCFGSCIVRNLKNNLKEANQICGKCGKRFTPINAHQKYCENCGYEYQKIGTKFRVCSMCGDTYSISAKQTHSHICPKCIQKNQRTEKPVTCLSCGKKFFVKMKDNRTQLCRECYDKKRKEYQRNFYKSKSSQI